MGELLWKSMSSVEWKCRTYIYFESKSLSFPLYSVCVYSLIKHENRFFSMFFFGKIFLFFISLYSTNFPSYSFYRSFVKLRSFEPEWGVNFLFLKSFSNNWSYYYCFQKCVLMGCVSLSLIRLDGMNNFSKWIFDKVNKNVLVMKIDSIYG